MQFSRNHYNSSNILIIVLLSCFTTSISLVGLDSDVLSTIARILTYIVVIFLLVLNFYPTYSQSNIENRFVFLLLLAVWVGMRASNLYGIGLFFQALLLFLGALALSNINFFNKIDKALYVGGVAYICLAFAHFLISPIFLNTNYIGACGLLFCVYFLSRKTRTCNFFAIGCLLFILLSGTRSALLGLMLSLFIYYAFTQKFIIKYFILLLILVLTLFFLQQGYFDYLNSDSFAELVLNKTGKRIESGRFDIWMSIFSQMNLTDYIIGLGGGLDYEQIIRSKLSAHSGYVYIISSYGIIGLLLFSLASLFSLVHLFQKGYFYSFLLVTALLFREFFEVTLLHNSFPIALFFWAFLSNGYLDKNKQLQ